MNHNYKANILKSKYLYLLLSLIALLVFEFTDPNNFALHLIVTILFSLVFATVIYIIKKNLVYFYGAMVLALLSTVANLYNIFLPDSMIAIIGKSLFVIYSIFAISLISHEILFTKHITRDTIIGAVCVYFFIGVSYAIIYSIIIQLYPDAFLSTQTSAPIHSETNIFYFSFITLTTVGFGDIQPVHAIAKFFVMLESVTGIFYLAVFVSRLINRDHR